MQTPTCLRCSNLGVGPIRLMNMMDMRTPDDTQGDIWMIEPGQTKAFFVPAGPNGAFLGLMQREGGRGAWACHMEC